MVGNVFDTNTNTAIEPYVGATLLVEGNRFHKMRKVFNEKAEGGYLFLANDAADMRACEVAFGQPCLLNAFTLTKQEARSDGQVLADAVNRGTDAINDARQAAAQCAVVDLPL